MLERQIMAAEDTIRLACEPPRIDPGKELTSVPTTLDVDFHNISLLH